MNLIKKISIVLFSFLFTMCLLSLIYTFLIMNTNINSSTHSLENISLIIGIICYSILGLMSGIVFKKTGLLSGFISSATLVISIQIINYLAFDKVSINYIKILIFLLSAMTFSIIGANYKKRHLNDVK